MGDVHANPVCDLSDGCAKVTAIEGMLLCADGVHFCKIGIVPKAKASTKMTVPLPTPMATVLAGSNPTPPASEFVARAPAPSPSDSWAMITFQVGFPTKYGTSMDVFSAQQCLIKGLETAFDSVEEVRANMGAIGNFSSVWHEHLRKESTKSYHVTIEIMASDMAEAQAFGDDLASEHAKFYLPQTSDCKLTPDCGAEKHVLIT
jgi:hypothetical protein